MKIAFSTNENKKLESNIADHFGRCKYFIFVNLQDEKIKTITTKENPFFESHQPGQVPNSIDENNAKVMIAKGMGPRAQQIFETKNIKTITTKGKIKEVLDQYLSGTINQNNTCNH